MIRAPGRHAAFVALVLAVVAGPDPAGAAESFHGCASRTIATLPATITTPGRWCLTTDLTTSIASGAAIGIKANDVVLECNGFGIAGTAPLQTTQATGISVDGRNASVRGCRVIGFQTGIRVTGDAAIVEDNLVRAQQRVGISVAGDGGRIARNLIRQIGDIEDPVDSPTPRLTAGIAVNGGSDVLGNTIHGVFNGGSAWEERTHGIRMWNARGTSVRGNRIRQIDGNWNELARAGIRLGVNTAGVSVDGNDLYAVGIGIDCAYAESGIVRNNTQLGPNGTLRVRCADGGGNLLSPD